MQSNNVLYIRSGAAGLPGPYLEENMAPYKILDQIGDTKPRIILFVQGHTKQSDGANDARGNRRFAVSLGRHGHNLVVTCDMHLQPDDAVPRIMADPVPGNYCYHLVETAPKTMRDLAYRVYYDVFFPFSNIVLMPVADFGGLEQVISFICFWIRRRQLYKLKLRTHFILATKKHLLKDV